MHGTKVIGSSGGAKKFTYVTTELGFNAAWNYKAEKRREAVAQPAPESLNVYYDNIGDEQLESALLVMKDYGTIGKITHSLTHTLIIIIGL